MSGKQGIKPYTEAQKVTLLTEIESIMFGPPKTAIGEACRQAGIHYSTYYAWKKQRAAGRLKPRTYPVKVPQYKVTASNPAPLRTTAPPPAVPSFLEDAVRKEVNAFCNQMDARIHAAMEAAVISISERYNNDD